MTRLLSIAGEHGVQRLANANSGGAKDCTETTASLHLIEPLVVVSKQLWPVKTAEHLAAYSGCGLRTAKLWLSKRGALSFARFLVILRGEYGDKFLTAYMGGSKAKWWRRKKDVLDIAALRRAQAEQAKRLAQIEMNFAADD